MAAAPVRLFLSLDAEPRGRGDRSALRPRQRRGDSNLTHAARQKAANLVEMPIPPIRRDHGRCGAVRAVDHGAIWYIDPFALQPDPVMAVLGFPIDIIEPQRIGAVAAR